MARPSTTWKVGNEEEAVTQRKYIKGQDVECHVYESHLAKSTRADGLTTSYGRESTRMRAR